MMKTTAVQQPTTPATAKGGVDPLKASAAGRDAFLSAALTMSWQLAIVVLVPIIGGVELDKAAKNSTVFAYIGLAIAAVGSVVVMWQAMQKANRMPVPKLSVAQKKAIKKQYEAEDDD